MQTQEIATILNVLIDYVQSEFEIMGRLYEECARKRSEEAIAQEIVGLAELEELDDDDNKTIWERQSRRWTKNRSMRINLDWNLYKRKHTWMKNLIRGNNTES